MKGRHLRTLLPPSRAHQGGFTLLEALVALSLLGVAMLLTLSLMFQEPRVTSRLAAHQQVLRALEETLERVRAGQAVPLGQHLIGRTPWSLPESSAARDLRIWSVREEESAGLYRLSLVARYRVGEQWFDRSIETRVWSPP